MSRIGFGRRLAFAALAIMAGAHSASAHHPMGGTTPSTFAEGLLSGLGHPVIGPDHLAFLVAIGIAAALIPAGVGVIAAFIAASTAGVLLHFGAFDLPMSELLVAGSVLVAGAFVALGRRTGSLQWLVLAALAGVFHGYAFGEAIVGADRAVVGSYLLGLAIVSAGVAAVVMSAARWIVPVEGRDDVRIQAAGAAVGIVGAVMLASGIMAG
jgi:urease accessory protein